MNFLLLIALSFFASASVAPNVKYVEEDQFVILKYDNETEYVDQFIGEFEHDPEAEEDQIPFVCTVCKWAVGQLESYVYNKTNVQIRNWLYDRCDEHPTYKKTCREIVPTLMNAVHYILNKYAGLIVCQLVKLC